MNHEMRCKWWGIEIVCTIVYRLLVYRLFLIFLVPHDLLPFHDPWSLSLLRWRERKSTGKKIRPRKKIYYCLSSEKREYGKKS